jgi:hypothetical protein
MFPKLKIGQIEIKTHESFFFQSKNPRFTKQKLRNSWIQILDKWRKRNTQLQNLNTKDSPLERRNIPHLNNLHNLIHVILLKLPFFSDRKRSYFVRIELVIPPCRLCRVDLAERDRKREKEKERCWQLGLRVRTFKEFLFGFFS